MSMATATPVMACPFLSTTVPFTFDPILHYLIIKIILNIVLICVYLTLKINATARAFFLFR